MTAFEVAVLSRFSGNPASATTQLPSGLLVVVSVSPNTRRPIVTDTRFVVSADTVMVEFEGTSIALKKAALPEPPATMPLSQLLVSVQPPPSVLVQVPFCANAETPMARLTRTTRNTVVVFMVNRVLG